MTEEEFFDALAGAFRHGDKGMEAVLGKRVTGVETEGGWPVLRFDDGSSLIFIDHDGVGVDAEYRPPDEER